MPFAAGTSAACSAREFHTSGSESAPPGANSALPSVRVGSHDLVDELRALRGLRRCSGRRGHRRAARRAAPPTPEARSRSRGRAVARSRFVEVVADALAGDAPDHLADEPSVSGRVVAVLRARLVVRHLLRRARRRPGSHDSAWSSDISPSTHASPAWCDNRILDRDVGLAAGRELGPVLRDRRVDVERAFLRELVGAHRGRALRRGEDERERVLVPRSSGVEVGGAAPQVDDLLAAVVRAERRADLEVLGEVRLERVPHTLRSRSRPVVPLLSVMRAGLPNGRFPVDDARVRKSLAGSARRLRVPLTFPGDSHLGRVPHFRSPEDEMQHLSMNEDRRGGHGCRRAGDRRRRFPRLRRRRRPLRAPTPTTCLPAGHADAWPAVDERPSRTVTPACAVWHDSTGWHVRVTHVDDARPCVLG